MMQFNYVDFELPDGRIISRPVIECFMIYQKRGLFVEGIIDSGADNITLSQDYAEFFGIELRAQSKTHIAGVGGTADVVVQEVTIVFADGHKIEHVPVNFIFNPRYENVAIFGRLGIFTEFDIEFKERERKVLFRH